MNRLFRIDSRWSLFCRRKEKELLLLRWWGATAAVTVDSLSLNARSFIKLDIEGYEWKALLGAVKTVKSFTPWISIENKPGKVSFCRKRSKAEKILRKWKYTLVEKIGTPPIDWLFRPQNL